MLNRSQVVSGLIAVFYSLGCSTALAGDLAAINAAEFGGKVERSNTEFDPIILKAQTLLDRRHFSPGEIDGRSGESFKKALVAFGKAEGIRADGKLDTEVWTRLIATSDDPVLIEYTLTDKDVKGPFLRRVPSKMEEMANLERLNYTSVREALAERFHMIERLLRALNPGKTLDRAGTKISVANVGNRAPSDKVTTVEIDKSLRLLRAFGKDGQLLAVFPASIGSKEKPAPSGTFRITSVARHPSYTYNPKYQFKGVKSNKPFTIKPGPNNPVGTVWINLSLKGYGIHGTPDPSKVGKTESHGCIRLTNWDAETLASMVGKGTAVAFQEGNPNEAMASRVKSTRGSSRHKR